MNQFNLPTSWDEISYGQYIELKELDSTDLTFFSKYIEILAILTDTTSDDEIWEDISVEEISTIIKGLKWLKNEPKGLKQTIDKYSCKDVYQITLGEFIDLEHYFKDNYINNLPKIASVFFRQTKQDEWGNIVFEPYDNIDLIEREKVFFDLPITSIFGLIKYYLEFKEVFYENYQNLFEPNVDEEDEDELIEEELTPEEKAEIAKEQILAQYNWENILYSLSNSDITKYDELTGLSVIFIFNQLSFKKAMQL
jgi:hypothetical protein